MSYSAKDLMEMVDELVSFINKKNRLRALEILKELPYHKFDRDGRFQLQVSFLLEHIEEEIKKLEKSSA